MKTIRVVIALGVGSMLLVMLSMLVTLQHNPKIKALLKLSDNIRIVFALKEVIVSKRPANIIRVDFYTREPLLSREIAATMQAIGLYVWNHYRSKKAPAKVKVVYHPPGSNDPQPVIVEIERPERRVHGK